MSKYIELEDTILWKTKIVSFNIDNIDYIEKFNRKRIVIGYKGTTSYYIDSSVNNLANLYVNKLISYEFIDFNYREKSFDVNQYIYTNEKFKEYFEKKRVNKK